MANKVEITLSRSLIGRPQEQRDTVEALGLRKVNHSIVKEDNSAIRGMISKVSHLLTVKELNA
ncbi:50S ribosomal protein L30 [Salibacterium halotolerans]|uniref:Large ribosomal subunit protein uL30 n=1 Tax=Salibacterium halotolerans TaxID=1884432 RepID=A0A1I5WFZ1_9BACI|nr:50S ribosomal protein L30 [Salibacterium halotolerans]SFQ18557.1 large subunit ribosomal protein L30 [Salibacterium halotolerans]